VIEYLKEAFPTIERITSYARSKTCAKKTLDELKELHHAGFSRVLIGLESGCDPVLAYMQKGVTAEEQIRAGQRVAEAGIHLVAFVMPGLGARRWSE
ncbi:MAG: radical SAM protein, partial [Chloroflexota bacterium]